MKKLLSFVLVLAMLMSLSIAIPVSAEEAQTTQTTVSKWDGNLPETVAPFKTLDGTETNRGTESNPYIIGSAADLANFAKALQSNMATYGSYFSLTCDIDMNGHKWVGLGNNSDVSNKRFEGTFLGNNHVIYNLQMESGANCGFFNITQSATIRDLGIASGNIDVTYSAGHFNVGGLVGIATGGTVITNCFSNVNITVDNAGSGSIAKAGLLIGNINTNTSHASRDFRITDCWANGNIYVKSTNKMVNVGGLIGTHGKNPLFVENCTVTGNIYSTNGRSDDKFGAFVSDNAVACTFTNCNALINIKTGVAPDAIPGAIGKNWAGAITSNGCYRKISLDVNGTITENPTPTTADNFTPTTEDIKLVTSTGISNNMAQNGVGSNVGNIRFISELAFSVGAFSKTGYIVEFGGRSAEIGGKVVFTSLLVEGSDTPLTPTNGKYFIAYGISNVPASVTGTITVTPYATLLDGTTIYGASANYSISAGTLQK